MEDGDEDDTPSPTAGDTESVETPTEQTESEPSTDSVSESTSALTEPIYEFWNAYNEKDAAEFVDVFHPDSPDAPKDSEVLFQGTVIVDSATVISRSEDSATVEAKATISGELNESQTQTYELRRYESEWKIWSFDGEDTPSSPRAQFEFEYDDAGTEDRNNGLVTVTHAGGDTIDAEKLYVRGTGIVETADVTPDVTASDTAWGSATGDTEVTAGTEITVGVTAECVVLLVWKDEGSIATLATFGGPDA